MGSQTASEWSEQVAIGRLKLENALSYHLTGNHFPPLPTSLIPCCIKAINNGNNGLWDKGIKLPVGITWKGKKTAPTRDCIQAWHLSFFLDSDDEEE